ncbi:MAG: hypothetical protein JWN40_5649 [Phycisphaerales bacterium]|nr:hypothetical protein [Phycisphaerales bacterium]
MAVGSFSIFSILFALLSGGANDLLDFVSSDAYWKAKGATVSVEQLAGELKTQAGADVSELIKTLGNGDYPQREEAARKIVAQGAAALPGLEKAADDPDAEISNRARNLIQQIRLNSKANGVRRLMAIRTLGEMKKAEALPILKPLLASKEMFVADYAARAIAQIEGKAPLGRGAAAGLLKADLSLLPADCGVVGQLSLASAKIASVDEAVKTVPPQPGEDRKAVLEQMNTQVITIVDQIGNVRIESVTFGVCDTIGPNDGYFAAIVRGKYDSAAVSAFIRNMGGMPVSTVAGATVLTPDQHMAFAFPGDDRALFVTGATPEKLPVKQILEAAAAVGTKEPAPHPVLAQKEFAPFIASLNDSARLWAVCKVSDSYRGAPVIQPFDTITLLGRQEKDKLSLRIAGAGKDAAAVKSAVDQVNQGVNEAKTGLAQVVQQMPMLKPMAEFVQSIDCAADGKNATMTGTFQGDTGNLLAFPLMLFSARAQAQPIQAPPAVIEPVKPEK